MDETQTRIVDAFRRLGCSVQHLHQLGAGVPDLLIACNSRATAAGPRKVTFLVECKREGPPSAQRLTKDQVEFHAGWKGEIYIVSRTEDVAGVILRACRDAEVAA